MAAGRDQKDWLLDAGMSFACELSLSGVLQRIVDLACEITHARYGALGVLDETGHVARLITSGMTDRRRQAIGALPRGRGVLGAVIRESKPVRLRHVSDDHRSVGFPPNHPAMDSFLGVPVMAGGRVLGNLYLAEKRTASEFSQEDEDALVVLASQAGVAVANAVLHEELGRRQRWLEAFREVVASVLGGSDWHQLLELVVQRARQLTETELAAAVVPVEEDGRLWIAAAAGWGSERLRGLEVPLDGSISGDVLRTGEPVVLDDLGADPRAFQPIVRQESLGPTILVPLRAHGRPFGTLVVANHTGGRLLGAESLHLLETFADQAAVALEYVRAQRELQRLTVLEERERIAKELHDGIIQSLFAIGMELQAASSQANPETGARLQLAVREIDRSISDLRTYIFQLRPGILSDRRLGPAIRDMAEDLRRRAGIEVECELEPHVAADLAGRSSDVIQLVREALSNVARHAQARHCRITLRAGARGALLSVHDDGRGFDAQTVEVGSGLRNMRDRARQLGGHLRVVAAPGRGATLTFTLPR